MKKIFVIVMILVLSFTATSFAASSKAKNKTVVQTTVASPASITTTAAIPVIAVTAVPTATAGMFNFVKESFQKIISGTTTQTASVAIPATLTAKTTMAIATTVTAVATETPVVITTKKVATPSVTPMSASKKVAGKNVENEKIDHFQIGFRLRSFNGLNTATQPIGFQTSSSDENAAEGELSLQLKIWRFGLEYLPLETKRTLSTEFYGASLGEVDISTSNVLIAKFFAVDTNEYSVSIGLGVENTKIGGPGVSMGGFVFPTTGEGWSTVFQVGAQYHLTDRFSLGASYERSNVKITTRMEGVPDLASTYTDRLAASLTMGLF